MPSMLLRALTSWDNMQHDSFRAWWCHTVGRMWHHSVRWLPPSAQWWCNGFFQWWLWGTPSALLGTLTCWDNMRHLSFMAWRCLTFGRYWQCSVRWLPHRVQWCCQWCHFLFWGTPSMLLRGLTCWDYFRYHSFRAWWCHTFDRSRHHNFGCSCQWHCSVWGWRHSVWGCNHGAWESCCFHWRRHGVQQPQDFSRTLLRRRAFIAPCSFGVTVDRFTRCPFSWSASLFRIFGSSIVFTEMGP